MKKSTKKLLAVMMCAAMAGSALAGCSSGDSQTTAAATEAPTQAQTTEEAKEAAAEPEKAEESKEATEAAAPAAADMASADVKKKDPDKHYKFGYTCMDGTNPFFVTIEKRMREMVEANGDELIAVDPANDVTLQITQVEDLISQNIDAMFMNPAEAEGILPALDQLKEAGIPIVGFDTEVADLSYLISYTGSDNYNAGKVCGEDLVKNGFLDAIEGKGFNIVAQQDAKGNLEVSMGIAEDLLQAHGDVVAIFGGNDPTALGALAAANAAGLTDCMIYGVDGSPDIKAEMASGESLIEGSGAQSPVKIAQSAVNIMYTYLNGDKVESRYPVETFLITSENVDKYGTDGWQ